MQTEGTLIGFRRIPHKRTNEETGGGGQWRFSRWLGLSEDGEHGKVCWWGGGGQAKKERDGERERRRKIK